METPEAHRARIRELCASASRQLEPDTAVEQHLEAAGAIPAAWRELAELTVMLRGDLAELARLAGRAEPRRSRRP